MSSYTENDTNPTIKNIIENNTTTNKENQKIPNIESISDVKNENIQNQNPNYPLEYLQGNSNKEQNILNSDASIIFSSNPPQVLQKPIKNKNRTPQKRVLTRESLFYRYISLCKSDSSIMEKNYFYLNKAISSAHFISVFCLYLNSTLNQRSRFLSFKNNLGLSTLFLIANGIAYKCYNRYFLKQSFVVKYRDIDNFGLDNILRSLEENKLKLR